MCCSVLMESDLTNKVGEGKGGYIKRWVRGLRTYDEGDCAEIANQERVSEDVYAPH